MASISGMQNRVVPRWQACKKEQTFIWTSYFSCFPQLEIWHKWIQKVVELRICQKIPRFFLGELRVIYLRVHFHKIHANKGLGSWRTSDFPFIIRSLLWMLFEGRNKPGHSLSGKLFSVFWLREYRKKSWIQVKTARSCDFNAPAHISSSNKWDICSEPETEIN